MVKDISARLISSHHAGDTGSSPVGVIRSYQPNLIPSKYKYWVSLVSYE